MDSAGRARHASQVERGKACGCVCPDCKTALIAHQGNKYAKHFRHATTTTCRGESALHLAGKQALVDAAAAGESVATPELTGQLSQADIRGDVQHDKWSVHAGTYRIGKALCEAAVGNDLRADVVLHHTGPKPALAVEIRVTHAKGDAEREKYLGYGHDAIEIDLSRLPWNATPDEVSRAVLSEAPRQWLHCAAAERAKTMAKAKLDSDVRDRNASLVRLLEQTVRRLRDEEWLTSSRFPWPTLVETVPDDDYVDGNQATASPQLTSVDPKWRRGDDYIWRGSGIVGGKPTAAIEVGLSGMLDLVPARDHPVLAISVSPGRTRAEFRQSLRVCWLGVDHWRKKLRRNARKGVIRKDKTLLSRGIGYLEDFHYLSASEQMEVVAQEWLRVPPPSDPGEWSYSWGTHYRVWTSVIWYHEILRGLFGGHIDYTSPDQIALSDFYSTLFDWPDDDESLTQRYSDAKGFLHRLEKHSVLCLEGSGYAANEYPRVRIVPWEV